MLKVELEKREPPIKKRDFLLIEIDINILIYYTYIYIYIHIY